MPINILRLILALLAYPALCAQAAELTPIPIGDGQLRINEQGLRFSFVDAEGKTTAPAHHGSGASLNGSALNVEKRLDGHRFALVSQKGQRATLTISHNGGHTQFSFVPEVPATHAKPHLFTVQLGGMPVAYGLGDVGGWNETLNLVNEEETSYKIRHDGGRFRWLSSFAVFPQNRVAGVCFGGQQQVVTLSKSGYKMAVKTSEAAVFSFFTGSMPDLYASYQKVLKSRGYPLVKPKFRLFELGWESWAALGWQTNSKTMLESITQFQESGFPIRWAVSGSGFWEKGGTTTSFGKFGEKFPDPIDFKKKLHTRDVKWMIGLRTNFVPPGGPYKPVTKERDQNLVVDTFKGNPSSQKAIDKKYFLKNPDGTLWKKHSKYFPIVPCYLLDGKNTEAADWYAKLYEQWAVDGVKEDTMMNLGTAHLDVFNHPIANIARLADEHALVMARCGSYTSPGTLLRINDTSVGELSHRTPINYLQNAACGAPNAYSDTVGFKKMKSYTEQVIRHAWLTSLTAGMAVGESAAHWTEQQQAILKRPFDFHYQIAPALYDAAMKSYQSGFPYTMTPLGIAYPNDPQATEPAHFQWMIGESLLCAPLLKKYSTGKMDVYLPKGSWFDYDTGEKHLGPKLLKDFAMPVDKTPCFVGGKGILVTRSSDDAPLKAHIYPVDALPESFTFHHPDGKSTSTLRLRKGDQPRVWNAATGKQIPFEIAAASGALCFDLQPDMVYEYVR